MNEADIAEKFIRSEGKGGQNVNKVSTCVYLKHIPTGIEVKCQQERSQAQNRILARKILAEKIAESIHSREKAEQARIEKLKRQMRKRSRAYKERMLEEKRRQSQKKFLRKHISLEQ